MSAELLAMLDAARALHERNPDDPVTCETCSTNDRWVAWPCDTAKALGATGRSEWKSPTDLTAPQDPGQRECGVTRSGSLLVFPCVLNFGHGAAHMDRDGDYWD